MKFFGRRGDRDPSTTQKSPPAVLPPLEFTTPAPLEPNDFPPDLAQVSTNFHVVAPPVQRWRRMDDKRDDKPFPNPAWIPILEGGAYPESFHGPVPEGPISKTNYLLPPPRTPIPKSKQHRRIPPINTGPTPAFRDATPTRTKSKHLPPKLLPPTPVSGSPDRNPPTKPAPEPEPLSSGLFDRPRPRRKHPPVEATDPHDTSYTTTSLSEIGRCLGPPPLILYGILIVPNPPFPTSTF